MRRIRSKALGALETAVLLALCGALLSGLWAAGRQRQLSDRLIRLHVRAASDSAADQAVKLAVRDGVLSLAEPALRGARSREEAARRLREQLPTLAAEAARISGGRARASLAEEWFPTREYGDFSLPAGRYAALRITLGSGEGRNWWCVVYPPLCAAGTEEAREAGLISPEDVKLITGDGEGYVIRFRVIEWWQELMKKGEGREDASPG